MTDAAKKLLEDFRALPAEDRRWLRDQLDDSAEDESGDEIALHEAWNDEILRRIERVRSGESKPVPGDEVEARLRAKFAKA